MHLIFYVDGGVLGRNPSTIGIYYSVGVQSDCGSVAYQTIVSREERRDFFTNNDAEMAAVHRALTIVAHWLTQGALIDVVTINSDSQLAVGFTTGTMTPKVERLVTWATTVQAALRHLTVQQRIPVFVQWVPRDENVKRLGH